MITISDVNKFSPVHASKGVYKFLHYAFVVPAGMDPLKGCKQA